MLNGGRLQGRSTTTAEIRTDDPVSRLVKLSTNSSDIRLAFVAIHAVELDVDGRVGGTVDSGDIES